MTALCVTSAPALGTRAPAVTGNATVADALQVIVQVLADLGADAEQRRRRPVPRLAEPTSLADQLTVVVADLLAAVEAPVTDAAPQPAGVDLTLLADRLDAVRAVL